MSRVVPHIVRRFRETEIDADPPMELNVDGELVDLTTPATFAVCGTFHMIT